MAPPACQAADQQASQYPQQLLTFSATKEQQVRGIAADLKITVPSEISRFFAAATHGDYTVITNTMAQLAPQYAAMFKNPSGSLPAWSPFWQPMTEVESAYEAFATGGTKYPLAFGEDIVQSIPPGSIYFGGSDAGRMLVTALCESQVQGKPFYTLTQNALTDSHYLDYVRAMYGKQVRLLTTNDMETALDEYKADALRRYEQGKLRPNEDVQVIDGEVHVGGPLAVMAINARLVKVIMERNPKREFYMEESYPLDLLYPYLSPHGLILKLDHEPMATLTPQILDADHAFWANECQSMVGGWLKQDTSISNVCAFAEAVFGRNDLLHFNGDKGFVTNDFATHAFSQLRVAIAGLYAWRLDNDSKADDTARLRTEADYAFRQAFALCPTSPEVVFRYVNFLVLQGRIDDAILLAGTAQQLVPDNEQFHSLLSQLQTMAAQAKGAAH